MSSPEIKPDAPVDNRRDKLMDPPRETSPQTSNEQSGSNKSDAPKAHQVQPAVDDEAKLDQIDILSSPSSSKKTPLATSPPLLHRRSFSSIYSTFRSMTMSCTEVTKNGCGPKGWATIVLGFVLDLAVAVFHYSQVELHTICISIAAYGVFVCNKSCRGKWARQPVIPLSENKRNPYRDIPSQNDDNPMEPACPRPQQESPKDQVYLVDVHNPDLPTTLSSPSTSTAPKVVYTKGASGGYPTSTRSTSGEAAPVDVPVIPQSTENKEKNSEKDS